MPYPNEHACRKREPSEFQPRSFRRVTRETDGKSYSVIMGKLKGETTLTEQAYRYPKATWTAATARVHCKAHGGKTFEPAVGTSDARSNYRYSASEKPAVGKRLLAMPMPTTRKPTNIGTPWSAPPQTAVGTPWSAPPRRRRVRRDAADDDVEVLIPGYVSRHAQGHLLVKDARDDSDASYWDEGVGPALMDLMGVNAPGERLLLEFDTEARGEPMYDLVKCQGELYLAPTLNISSNSQDEGGAECVCCERGCHHETTKSSGDDITARSMSSPGAMGRTMLMGDGFSFAVVEKAADKRYTFGVVYQASNSADVPELDTHGEFALPDDLQAAQWDYVRKGNRNIYLQHGEASTVIGEIVDIVTWPYEVEANFTIKDKVEKRIIPANSVWVGVVWTEEAWPLVKSGKISGLSMGGWARRLTR